MFFSRSSIYIQGVPFFFLCFLKDVCRCLTDVAPLYLCNSKTKPVNDTRWPVPRSTSLLYMLVVHRCITSNTDHVMKIQARITLTVECIRTCLVVLLLNV